MGKYHTGYYSPQYPEKYLQPLDRTMNKAKFPQYRSSWELKFMRFCDRNPLVLKWGVEPFAIQYWNPIKEKMSRYYVDGYIEFKNGKRFIVEIKPYKETREPKPPRKQTSKGMAMYYSKLKTWKVNESKWEAARKWASERGMKFIILTEKELGV